MPYYEEVIDDLQWCVKDMQQTGILVDTDLAASYIASIEAKLEQEKKDWKALLGRPFNPNASAQVIDLFAEFGVPLKTKKGEWSSDALTMLKATVIPGFGYPVAREIITFRELMKLRGTYLKPDPWADGRLRSAFRLYGTLTWRLSSREPNLQNLPRSPVHGVNIKDIYIAPPGKVLVELDYSALEDRIPAFASCCTKLIQMFLRGENTHLYRAGIIFGVPLKSKKEAPEKYDFSKRLRYSRGYGAAILTVAEKLLEDTHEWHPPEEIGPMLKRLDDDMPEIIAWHNKCWAESEQTGLSFDGFGVPRTLFEPPGQRRQVAYSDPTQRTASGIMNRSMVRYYRANKAGMFRHDTLLICQVHDSLLFEMNEDHYIEESNKVKSLMETPVTIFGQRDVLFPVEAKMGKSWGTMKEL